MDNLIIGLLPTVTPTDDMKIAVSGGLHAVTIGDLKAYINKDSGNSGSGGNDTLKYTFTKSDGTVYTNTVPNMTNAELKSGFTVKITSDYTDPITWSTTAEGISGSYDNSGYSAFFTLDDGGVYDSGTELDFSAKINNVEKLALTITVSG